MKVGILETGTVPADLQPRFGTTYASMMARMLGEGFDCIGFDVKRGELPAAPEDCAAYIVTGSAASVYDDLPWIAPLEDFLRRARGRAKLIGICFGHQLMAQAFGGQVAKSERGWGLGLHDYAVTAPEHWSTGAPSIGICVSHQDQVLTPPPGARVVGGSAFTPYGILAYGEDAISFQCHPEFEPAFVAELIAMRKTLLPGADAADTMLASLDRPNDRARVAGWIRAFLAP